MNLTKTVIRSWTHINGKKDLRVLDGKKIRVFIRFNDNEIYLVEDFKPVISEDNMVLSLEVKMEDFEVIFTFDEFDADYDKHILYVEYVVYDDGRLVEDISEELADKIINHMESMM